MTLEELFRENHASLFRFVARMTNDPDLAKDIVQDTFVDVAGRGNDDPVPSRAWLFQIARNLTRSRLRRRGRRLRLLRGAPGAGVPDPVQPPDTGVEREEARSAVRAALASLAEKERTILLMREEGFTHREIADAVGTTTGSVGTMHARALRKLETRLGDLGEELR